MNRNELSLSEEFHKAKRTLIATSSVTSVLALSQPSKLKVPGISGDAVLTANWAFAVLFAALVYQLVAFLFETSAMRVRNSEASNGDGKDLIDERMAVIAASYELAAKDVMESAKDLKLTSEFAKDFASMSDMRAAISESSDSLETYLAGIKASMGGRYVNVQDWQVNGFIQQLNQKTNELWQRHLQVDSVADAAFVKTEAILVKLNDISSTVMSLSSKFSKLSSRISKSQRNSFKFVHVAVPIALAAFAITSALRFMFGI